MISMTWPQYLRGECRVDGRVLKLQGRMMVDALAILLMRYPAPVHRDEFIEAFYPDPDKEPDCALQVVYRVIQRLMAWVGLNHFQTRRPYGWRLIQHPLAMAA